MNGGLKLNIIQSISELDQYSKIWDEVLADSSADTLFLTYDWIWVWWNIYGKNKELLVMIARDSDKVVGIAPLYKERRRFMPFMRFEEIRFLGDQHVGSDFLNFIARKGFEGDVIPLFMRVLKEKTSWNSILLNEIVEHSQTIEILRSWTQSVPLDLCVGKRFTCPTMSFPKSYDDFMNLPDATFKKIVYRKDVARLYKNHEVKILTASREDEIDLFLEKLFELHSQRWNDQGLRGSFRDPRKRKFYREVSRYLLEKGFLRLRIIEVDGTVDAVKFGMEYHGAYYSLQGGISRRGLELKAGNVISFKVFKGMIGQISTLHFLRGDEMYKYQWGAHDHWTVSLGICQGVKGKVWSCVNQIYKKLRRRVKWKGLKNFILLRGMKARYGS